MKRIAACLALTLCAGAAPGTAPVSYNAFGVTALQRLSIQSKNENVFISPVSIGVALAMASDGANGPTRDQILKTLGVSGGELDAANAALIGELTHNVDASVGIANAIWTRSDIKPRSQYVALLKQHYGAQVQSLTFGDESAARTINEWTKAHTLGLIDRIVKQTHADDFLYLTNAIAFKAMWTAQFKKNQTRPMPFTNADGGKSTVPMMSQDGNFQTADTADYGVLRMPYGHGGYAAYILLPHGSEVDSLVKTLTPSTFDRIVPSLQDAFMRISVPRFTAQYNASLIPLLHSMGMTAAFSGGADFSGIHAIPPRLVISSLEHAAYVRVDEQGTTAAAATSVGMTMTAIRLPEKSFIVDHPFVLALRDEHTGTLLFIGAIRTLKA